MEQANKLLINYLLMVLGKVSKKRFAFWGHGINLQDDPDSIRNRFKKLYSKQCDWWFAYTDNVKKTVVRLGFDENKITVVQNAIDTKTLVEAYNQIPVHKLSIIRAELGLAKGPVGLYCGGMYKEKRLDFLLATCEMIRQNIPGFEMIFIGAGPDGNKVKKAAEIHKWIHYLGPKFGVERVPYFKLADVFLMPALVGLAILDTFAMQTPIITTNYPFHGPEIEYLVNGKNGLMVSYTLEEYSQKVIEILNNEVFLQELREGCRVSAFQYTLENMVFNFVKGIKLCLAT